MVVRYFLRSSAFVALIALAGLPLMTLVCARECTAPPAVAADESDHCQKPEPAATASISAVAAETCDSPFNLTNVAARDRAQAPAMTATMFLPPQHARVVGSAGLFTRAHLRAPPIWAPQPRSTLIPLRI